MKLGMRKILAAVIAMLCIAVPAALADGQAVLTLPASLQVIGEEAFCGATAIGRVVVPEGITAIGKRAFADSSVTSINLPLSVTSIAHDAFSGCGDVDFVVYEGSFAENWCRENELSCSYVPTTSASDFEYTIHENMVGITAYNGTASEVIVPPLIEGLPVVALDTGCFAGCAHVTSIQLPQSIYYIGDAAFVNCNSLEEINIPEGVGGLRGAFINCYKLEEIDLPESLGIIGESCFANCPSLRSIHIPEGVRQIGEDAFMQCYSLKNIFIPNGVESIGANAFSGCYNVTGVYIPETVSSIGANAFDAGISDICVHADTAASAWMDEAGYNYTTLLKYTFRQTGSNTVAITGYNDTDDGPELPDTVGGMRVTAVADHAFENNQTITWVGIGKYIRTIGDYAFANCPIWYADMYLSSVTSIGDHAFENCDNLNSRFRLGENVQSIGDYAFADCDSIHHIYIPASVYSIGDYAFAGCDMFTSINTSIFDELSTFSVTDEEVKNASRVLLYNGLTHIGAGAFADCPQMESVVLPITMKDVPENLFAGCSNMQAILIPESVKGIELSALQDCENICAYVYENSFAHQWCDNNGINYELIVTSTLGEEDFEYFPLDDGTLEITGYKGQSSVVLIPASIGGMPVSSIGENAFEGHSEINHMEISEGITSIKAGAFNNCADLENLFLPESLKEIGDYCISGTRLTTLTIPAGVESLGANFAAYNADLQMIHVSRENTSYKSENGVVFTADGETLLAFPCANPETEYVVPEGVKHIVSGAFGGNLNLTSVYIPDGASLGTEAFCECAALEMLRLPADLTEIPDGTFAGCKYLNYVELPVTLKSIGADAFASSGIDWINLPEGLEEIGSGALADTNLFEISIPRGVKTIGPDCFSGLNITAYVYNGTPAHEYCEANSVPYEVVDLETPAEYFNYTPLDETTAEITGYTGEDADVVIPAAIDGYAITAIGNGAFAENNNLFSVVVPEGVTILDEYAFVNCRNLRSITLPDSLESIKMGALSECGLESLYIPANVRYISAMAVDGNQYLAGYEVAADNPYFSTEEGVLYTDEGKTLHAYPGSGMHIAFAIPEGVTTITEGAFYNNQNLCSVTIPGSVISTGEYTFNGNWNLANAIISEGTLQIGDNAFADCENLYRVNIPDSMLSIGENAFNNTMLSRVHVPAAVTYIGDGAFPASTVLVVYEGSPAHIWAVNNGYTVEVLAPESQPASAFDYEINEETGCAVITGYKSNSEIVSVPAEVDGVPVEGIGTAAFLDNYDITAVYLAEGIEYIEEAAFQGCGSLNRIVLPESVIAVGSSAFGTCSNAEIVVSGKLKFVGDYAFSRCQGLSEIQFADDAEYIGQGAFLQCNGLTEVTIPGSINVICESAFSDCENLQKLVIREGISSIEKQAFFSCYNLAEVSIPETVTSIGENAFGNCHALTSIEIPGSVTHISDNAFYSDTTLAAIFGSYAHQWALENGYAVETSAPEAQPASDFAYEKDSETGEITILGYNGSANDVVVPAEIEGAPVVTIGEGAFRDNTTVTSVYMFDGITTISKNAFSGCSSIFSICVPETVNTIGDYAFRNCGALKDIALPEGITVLNSYLFYQCASLTEITIPESVTEIKDCVFYGCSGLSEITIPENVTTLGMNTFALCTGIVEFVIPDNVTKVGSGLFSGCINLSSVTVSAGLTEMSENMFYRCSALRSVTVPAGVTNVYNGMFRECWRLANIYVEEGNTVYRSENGVLYMGTGNRNTLTHYPIGKTAASFTVPDGVKYINHHAFQGCDYLTSIDLNGATTIYNYAFNDCDGLEDIDLSGVAYIGSNVFEGCDGLEEVTVPGTVTTVRFEAFNNCANLTKVVLEEGVTTISGGAFADCAALETVRIPVSVTSINATAFQGSENVTLLLRDETWVSWAEENGLDYLMLVSGATEDGFEYDTRDDGTMIITGYTGENTEVEVPGTINGTAVTAIADDAFIENTAITAVTLPASIADIGSRAFYGCEQLQSVNIPESVMTIGDFAFARTALERAAVPAGTVFIGQGAFSYCADLVSIDVNSANANYKSVDGVLFTANGTLLMCYPAGSTAASYTVPEGVSTIGCGAFALSANLNSIILPQNLETIEAEAFSGCTGLNYVSLYDGTIGCKIGDYAFRGCTGIGEMMLPDSATFGVGVFDGCTNLIIVANSGSTAHTYATENNIAWKERSGATEDGFRYSINADGTIAVIGYSGSETVPSVPAEIEGRVVSTLGPRTFEGQSAITGVVIPNSVTSLKAYTFKGTSITEINLPANVAMVNSVFTDAKLLTAVNAAEDCSTYKTIDGVLFTADGKTLRVYPAGKAGSGYTVPDGVENINAYAFRGNTNLTQVKLPAGLKTIGNYGFAYCSGITALDLPESLQTIGDSAFRDCTALTAITIPEGVEKVPFYSFYNCSSLSEVNLSEGLKTIGTYAFGNCQRLRKIQLPMSLESIEGSYKDAFYRPQYMTFTVYEGTFAYDWCTNYGFSCVMLPNPALEFEYTIAGGEVTIDRCISTKSTLTVMDTIDGCPVTAIGANAFANCTGLSNLTLLRGITRIGDGAFAGCENIVIDLPDTVEAIGSGLFDGCTNVTVNVQDGSTVHGLMQQLYPDIPLTMDSTLQDFEYTIDFSGYAIIDAYTGNAANVYIPEIIEGHEVGIIGANAFAGNTAMEYVRLPQSVNNIRNSAFEGCSALNNVELPEALGSLGTRAFANCTSFTEFHVPAGLNYIYQDALEGCTGLKEITVAEENTHYAAIDNVLYCYNVYSDESGNNITSMDLVCCAAVREQTELVIPDSVNYISEGAFEGCVTLKKVTVPASLEYLSEGVFSGCTSLESVVMEEGFRGSENMFAGCTGLKEVYIPLSITDAYGMFRDCTGLTSVTFAHGTDKIDQYMFENCTGLTAIELPITLHTIAANAFSGCTNLGDVILPSLLESISDSAFSGCENIRFSAYENTYAADWCEGQGYEYTALPMNIDSVNFEYETDEEGYAVITKYTGSAEEVLVPAQIDGYPVWCVGEGAFEDCDTLVNVYIAGECMTVDSRAFYDCDRLVNVIPQYELAEIGESAFEGCEYLHYADPMFSCEGNYGVVIGKRAFYGCERLVGHQFWYVVEIGESAFENCYAFSSGGCNWSTFDGPVTTIGARAFYNCYKLEEAHLPEGITFIGEDAFTNCAYGKFTASRVSGSYADLYCLANGIEKTPET